MRRLLAAFAAAFFVLAPAGATSALAAPPASAFTNADFLAMEVSPDGKTLAAYQGFQGGRALVFYPMDRSSAPKAVKLDPALRFRGLWWKGSDKVVFSLAVPKASESGDQVDVFTRFFSVSKEGGTPLQLLSDEGQQIKRARGYGFTHLLPNDPDHVLMQIFKDGALNLMKVNVNTGSAEVVERGENVTGGFLVDGNGEARLRFDIEVTTRVRSGADAFRLGDVKIMARPTGATRWTEVASYERTARRPEFRPLAATEDPNIWLFAVQRANEDRTTVRKFDIRNGQVGEIVGTHPKVDVEEVAQDPYTGVAIGVIVTVDVPEVRYFAEPWRTVGQNLKGAFPLSETFITSVDAAARYYTLITTAPDDPGTYRLLDTESWEVVDLGDRLSGLSDQPLGRVTAITYPARDGTPIPAYLTMPPGGGTNLPMVLLPHGGPEARDEMGFDPWAQFLATRGYVVLQPQFRGSAGYGRAWAEAGYGQWGRLMQDDLTDGVKHLIAQGTVDPERVCILGISYGGYATLAGMTITPELYRCGVSINGVSDLPEMQRWVRQQGGNLSPANDYWLRSIGSVIDEPEKIIPVTPARNAGKVQGALMLIHGSKDTVVPIEQARYMEAAMKKAGKPVEFVEVSGDDHSLTLPEGRLKAFLAFERFLETHIGR